MEIRVNEELWENKHAPLHLSNQKLDITISLHVYHSAAEVISEVLYC